MRCVDLIKEDNNIYNNFIINTVSRVFYRFEWIWMIKKHLLCYLINLANFQIIIQIYVFEMKILCDLDLLIFYAQQFYKEFSMSLIPTQLPPPNNHLTRT